MSQSTSSSDPEVGREPDEQVDGRQNDRRDDPRMQGESNFGDSSGRLFSIYLKAAEDEDNKTVERWQKDADGILIFTGLFSAAVAALLAVTVQDLRPNSQDISAFYLGNIYQVLADPNATRSSIPSPVTKPPSFSPSRYAIWVNSLWFLSLVMSLSCALWATSLHQWARRYLRQSQPSRCNPEKRARMRAFFAEGVDNMHIPWAVEGLPTLLHLSLFLFFGGLAIFLFDVDREVFGYVFWWIGLFCLVYGMITVLPLIRQDSPYNSPLSTPAWYLCVTTTYVTVKILSFIIVRLYIYFQSCFYAPYVRRFMFRMSLDIRKLGWDYRRRMLGGVEQVVEEAVSKRLSKVDISILDWTITSLGDDDSLKNFFEAIPGFFNSKLVKHLEGNIPEELVNKYGDALNGFLDRTLSSNSVNDSEKLSRVDIATNAMSLTRHFPFLFIKRGEMSQVTMARILSSVQERDDRWITLAARVSDLSEQELWENIGLGDDSVLLAVLIHVTRQLLHLDNYSHREDLEAIPKFNIRNTLPRQQHDFCTLWNVIVQEARKRISYSNLTFILHGIRLHYIALHQGTDSAPTAFTASTPHSRILFEPSSYPLCNLASHRPGSVAQQPALSPSQTDGDNTTSRQAEQVKNAVEHPSTSNPTTTSEIGATSHRPDTTRPTSPVHSGSRPTDASSTAFVAAAPQDITSTATSSYSLEGSDHQDSDMVAPSAEPGTSQILSTASTHAPAPILAPIPTSPPNTPSEPYNAGVASVRVSNSSHFPPPSIGSSIPASRPTGSATLPRPRARGLVNTGNICFVNAVLQLLVNLPPFWNLFRELGDQMGQCGPGVRETGGATPLVDATMRFFKEFIAHESLPSTEEWSQSATGGTSTAEEERKHDNLADSFEPMYMYDAMKEKTQLKPFLDGQQQDAEEFLRLYLDAIDEELSTLPASVSGRQSASATLEVEEREVSQSGQTVVGKEGFMANFVESPITHIFGGKFRSLVRTSNNPDVVTTEDWRSLHLDVLPDSVLTVQDALMRVSQSQSMKYGPSGSSDSDVSQQMLIEALPPILVLHLKRFRYDAAAGGVVKIGKFIQISSELDIPFDVMVPTARQPAKPVHYTLYGVLYHHGETAGGGHYTVDVLHPNGDGDTGEVWLRIDDEAVSPMRHEDVFGEHGMDQAADERCAYLLFYCRTPNDAS